MKLFPAMSSLVGPLKAVQSDLEAHGVSSAQAVFERSPKGGDAREVMSFVGGLRRRGRAPVLHRPSRRRASPCVRAGAGRPDEARGERGEGLAAQGDGGRAGPRRQRRDEVLRGPGHNGLREALREGLCVQSFMAEGMCQTSGCPLAASVGQALARASGKPVTHHGCTYDPVTQRATLRDSIEQ